MVEIKTKCCGAVICSAGSDRGAVIKAIEDGISLSFADLRNFDLRGISFRGVDLANADITGADTTDSSLTGAHLRGLVYGPGRRRCAQFDIGRS